MLLHYPIIAFFHEKVNFERIIHALVSEFPGWVGIEAYSAPYELSWDQQLEGNFREIKAIHSLEALEHLNEKVYELESIQLDACFSLLDGYTLQSEKCLVLKYARPLEEDLAESGLSAKDYIELHENFLQRILAALIEKAGAHWAHITWTNTKYDLNEELLCPFLQADRLEDLFRTEKAPLEKAFQRDELSLLWMLALSLPIYQAEYESLLHQLDKDARFKVAERTHDLLVLQKSVEHDEMGVYPTHHFRKQFGLLGNA